MNKYLIGIAILAVIFALATYSSVDSKKAEILEVSSAVVAIESSHDFGDIDIFDGKVSTTYLLKNNGVEDVNILSAATSCMCTEGEIGALRFDMHGSSGETVVIPAGGEEILKATFDPLAHGPNGVGKIKRELFIKTNSTTTPEIKVTFSANVIKNEQ